MPVGNSLDDIQAQLRRAREQAGAAAPPPEEVRVYTVNPAVQIDPQALKNALDAYAAQQKLRHNMTLASALEHGSSGLHHNRWRLAVDNEIYLQKVDQDKDLLPYLRQQLGAPDLYLELSIRPPDESRREAVPYTNEAKLAEMSQRNPALRKLQEIFKTRIIY
ncbi:MAG: hypothetical protein NW241_09370 [Bacteroidia bacterium]|nr:hypothetical protein [Bacteroidia bacterium]